MKYIDRNIRVFVSSTFQDMSAERDELVSRVFPVLTQKAAKRKVSLTVIDLRWGITEEESKMSKVVEICLEEIDKSHPFFIGLLGNRYGWIPNSEKNEWRKFIPEKYEDVISDIHNGKSMTEIEILYGVLHRRDSVHASFYVKKSEDDEKIDSRQKILRNEILKQKKYPVHIYYNLDELKETVIQDFERLLDELFPAEDNDSWSAIRAGQHSFTVEKARNFVGQETALARLRDFIDTSTSKGIVVTGESGMGKSALLSRLSLELEQDSQFNLVLFFAGNEEHNSTFTDMTNRICGGIIHLLGLSEDILEQENMQKWTEIISNIQLDKPLIIIIDGVEQIDSEGNCDWSWINMMPENVKFIVSTSTYDILEDMGIDKWEKYAVKKLSLDARVEFAEKYFSEFRKVLTVEQRQLLGRNIPLIDNTLLFKIVLDEIRRYGDFKTLNDFVKRLLDCNSVNLFFEKVFENQKRLLGRDKKQNLLCEIMALVCVSEAGLKEDDIIGVTCSSRLAVSEILCMNKMILASRNGRVCLAHGLIKTAVEYIFLMDSDYVYITRKRLVEYMEAQESSECVGEIAYQYYALEDNDNLYLSLTSIKAIDYFTEFGRIGKLVRYWGTLIKDFPERYDVLGYLSFAIESSDDPELGEMVKITSGMYLCSKLVSISRIFAESLHRPDIALRLLKALRKMFANAPESKELVEMVDKGIAFSCALNDAFADSFEIYLTLLDDNDTIDSFVVANIGEHFLRLYEQTQEEKYLNNALKIMGAVLEERQNKYHGIPDENLAVAYANYASALNYRDREKSMEMNLRSLEMYMMLNGRNDEDVAVQCHNIGLSLMLDDIDKALEYSNKALDIYKKIYGEDNYHAIREMSVVGEELLRKGECDQALTILQKASQLMAKRKELECDKKRMNTLLFRAYYDCEKYGYALTVAEEMLGLVEANPVETVEWYGNLAKVNLLMHETELAIEKYNEAIAIAFENNCLQQEMEQYAFLGQALWKLGMYEYAEERLAEAISRIETLEDESLVRLPTVAFLYYNHALAHFTNTQKAEECIWEVRKALSILEKNADESDASILSEYRKTLEILEKNSNIHTKDTMQDVEIKDADGQDDSSDNYPEVAEMCSYIGDEDTEIIKDFSQAMDAFHKGIVDTAIFKLEAVCKVLLSIDNLSANALATRFLAYSCEMYKLRSGKEYRNSKEIMTMYENSIQWALNVKNYDLAQRTSHDTAEFCWGLSLFDKAEEFYWKEIVCTMHQNKVSDKALIVALSNIGAAKQKQNVETPSKLMIALYALAWLLMYDLEKKGGENAEIRDNIRRPLEFFLQNEEVKDEHINEYGYHALTLSRYLMESKSFCLTEAAICMSNLAIGYFRQIGDKVMEARASVIFAHSLQRFGCVASAMNFISNAEKTWDKTLCSSEFKKLLFVKVNIYLSVYDFEQVEQICNQCNDNADEVISEFMENYMPCSYAFSVGKIEEAENLFQNVVDKDYGDLESHAIFDVANYCIESGRQYEARRAVEFWWKKINYEEPDISHFYNPAYELLCNKLRNME